MMDMTPLELDAEVSKHKSRWQAIIQCLEDCSTIMDVGAGTGQLARQMSGRHVISYDHDLRYVQYMTDLGLEAYWYDWAIQPVPYLPADAVVLAEVMEHQENPGIILKNAFDKARKKVVISLPLTHPNEPDHKWDVNLKLTEAWMVIEFVRRNPK